MAIDEMMIKCKSRFAAITVRMPLKPIRDGLMVFALCDSLTGYMYAFHVYTGETITLDDPKDNLGATAEMVISLATKQLPGERLPALYGQLLLYDLPLPSACQTGAECGRNSTYESDSS